MRVVLTGASSCGKTTLVNKLKKRGYQILDETARPIIEERKKLYGEVGDLKSLELDILDKQLQKESELNGTLVFLDRGLGDVVAYSKIFFDTMPDRIKNLEIGNRYDIIFLLEQLPLEKDGIRIEKSDEENARIHEGIREAYLSFGYDIIEVPVLKTKDERVDFVLNYALKNQKMKGGERK